MSRVLFSFLVRRHLLSTLLLLLVPLLLGLVVGLLYPTYAPQREALKVFKFAARFMSQGQIDPFSAAGAFSLPFQHPLCLVVFAVLGAVAPLGLIAGERGRGALDLLLATPLTRGALLRTAAGFLFVVALLGGLATVLAALLGAAVGADEPVPEGRFALLGLVVAAVILCFGGLALLVSVLGRDRGQATLWYGVVAVVFFAVDVAARMWQKGDWLGWLSPYGYLRPARTIAALDPLPEVLRDAGVPLALAAILFVSALLLERRRKSA